MLKDMPKDMDKDIRQENIRQENVKDEIKAEALHRNKAKEESVIKELKEVQKEFRPFINKEFLSNVKQITDNVLCDVRDKDEFKEIYKKTFGDDSFRAVRDDIDKNLSLEKLKEYLLVDKMIEREKSHGDAYIPKFEGLINKDQLSYEIREMVKTMDNSPRSFDDYRNETLSINKNMFEDREKFVPSKLESWSRESFFTREVDKEIPRDKVDLAERWHLSKNNPRDVERLERAEKFLKDLNLTNYMHNYVFSLKDKERDELYNSVNTKEEYREIIETNAAKMHEKFAKVEDIKAEARQNDVEKVALYETSERQYGVRFNEELKGDKTKDAQNIWKNLENSQKVLDKFKDTRLEYIPLELRYEPRNESDAKYGRFDEIDKVKAVMILDKLMSDDKKTIDKILTKGDKELILIARQDRLNTEQNRRDEALSDKNLTIAKAGDELKDIKVQIKTYDERMVDRDFVSKSEIAKVKEVFEARNLEREITKDVKEEQRLEKLIDKLSRDETFRSKILDKEIVVRLTENSGLRYATERESAQAQALFEAKHIYKQDVEQDIKALKENKSPVYEALLNKEKIVESYVKGEIKSLYEEIKNTHTHRMNERSDSINANGLLRKDVDAELRKALVVRVKDFDASKNESLVNLLKAERETSILAQKDGWEKHSQTNLEKFLESNDKSLLKDYDYAKEYEKLLAKGRMLEILSNTELALGRAGEDYRAALQSFRKNEMMQDDKYHTFYHTDKIGSIHDLKLLMVSKLDVLDMAKTMNTSELREELVRFINKTENVMGEMDIRREKADIDNTYKMIKQEIALYRDNNTPIDVIGNNRYTLNVMKDKWADKTSPIYQELIGDRILQLRFFEYKAHLRNPQVFDLLEQIKNSDLQFAKNSEGTYDGILMKALSKESVDKITLAASEITAFTRFEDLKHLKDLTLVEAMELNALITGLANSEKDKFEDGEGRGKTSPPIPIQQLGYHPATEMDAWSQKWDPYAEIKFAPKIHDGIVYDKHEFTVIAKMIGQHVDNQLILLDRYAKEKNPADKRFEDLRGYMMKGVMKPYFERNNTNFRNLQGIHIDRARREVGHDEEIKLARDIQKIEKEFILNQKIDEKLKELKQSEKMLPMARQKINKAIKEGEKLNNRLNYLEYNIKRLNKEAEKLAKDVVKRDDNLRALNKEFFSKGAMHALFNIRSYKKQRSEAKLKDHAEYSSKAAKLQSVVDEVNRMTKERAEVMGIKNPLTELKEKIAAEIYALNPNLEFSKEELLNTKFYAPNFLENMREHIKTETKFNYHWQAGGWVPEKWDKVSDKNGYLQDLRETVNVSNKIENELYKLHEDKKVDPYAAYREEWEKEREQMRLEDERNAKMVEAKEKERGRITNEEALYLARTKALENNHPDKWWEELKNVQKEHPYITDGDIDQIIFRYDEIYEKDELFIKWLTKYSPQQFGDFPLGEEPERDFKQFQNIGFDNGKVKRGDNPFESRWYDPEYLKRKMFFDNPLIFRELYSDERYEELTKPYKPKDINVWDLNSGQRAEIIEAWRNAYKFYGTTVPTLNRFKEDDSSFNKEKVARAIDDVDLYEYKYKDVYPEFYDENGFYKGL